ncbi:MAG TPA: hypothetical protein VKB53_05775, partial [Gammaproteobacteria bacterium]|nr:hypothetical protein [Gammaproteobacteria bacterium]
PHEQVALSPDGRLAYVILNSVEHLDMVGSRGGEAAPRISFLLRRAAKPRAATENSSNQANLV